MISSAAAVVALATAVAGSALVAGIATGSALDRPAQVEAPALSPTPIERVATTEPVTTPITHTEFGGGRPTPLRME